MPNPNEKEDLIWTTKGNMEKSFLVKKEGTDSSGAYFVEYYHEGELVHRSVSAGLTGVAATSEIGKCGG